MKVTDKDYYLDGYLVNNLNWINNTVRDDNHSIVIIDGMTGTGKSKFSRQIGYYWDNKLNVDKIVFTPQDFINTCNNAEKYSVVIWDEAITGAFSKNAMKGVNKTISVMINQIRQRNLFIILNIPYLFDLSRDIVLGHSWFLIHCTFTPNMQSLKFDRGRFTFYDRKKLKSLFMRGKKFYEYNVKSSFYGRFVNFETCDYEKYREKKSKIVLEEADKIPERDFMDECIRRGFKWKEIEGKVSYTERHFYRTKEKMNA